VVAPKASGTPPPPTIPYPWNRLLFKRKEAFYKAVYPLDQTFLDHHERADISVSVAGIRSQRPWFRPTSLLCITDHFVSFWAFLRSGTIPNDF